MDLKEISDKAKKIIANFVNEIGLNGDYYASTCNCPIYWGNPDLSAPGQFLSPSSEKLSKILNNSKLDEETKKALSQSGLILIDKNLKQKEPSPDCIITIIHEIIHSNRNLLLFDATRDGKNINAYTFNNGHFEQNTSKYAFSNADASQEILKGHIDTSNASIKPYKNMPPEELKNIDFIEDNIGSQISKQYEIDEALVELLALLSYKLYRNKEKGKETDFWSVLEETIDVFDGEENLQGKASKMGEIVLKHKDFELFNWMIDPISYSAGDIHYDFFKQYTQNDQDLLQEFYELAGLDLDFLLEPQESNPIDMKDIQEVATSPTAINKAPPTLDEMLKYVGLKKDENERE